MVPALQNTKGLTRTKKRRRGRRIIRFPLSTRRDLTSAQICPVANSLVIDNALAFVLENKQVIYEA